MDTDLMSVVFPPIPPQYGHIRAQQIIQLVASDIENETCTGEREKHLRDYYYPKIGDNYT